MALVASGLGVSLIPRRVADYAPRNSSAVPIDDPLATTSIDLWWWRADAGPMVLAFRNSCDGFSLD